MTIFARVLIACIFPLIAMLAVIIVLTNSIVYERVARSADENTKILAVETAKQVNDEFRNIRGLIEVVGAYLAETDPAAPGAEQAAADWIRFILKATPYIHSIWVSFEPGGFRAGERFSIDLVKSGDTIASINNMNDNVLGDPREAPWYYYPFTTGQMWFESADYYDYGTGAGSQYTGTLSAPIIRGGKTAGVVGIDLLYANTFRFINGRQVENEQLILVITQDGEIIYAPDSGLLTKSIFDMAFMEKGSVQRHLAAKSAAPGRGGRPFANSERVQERLAADRSFGVSGVSPFFGVRSNIYFHPISEMGADSRSQQLYLYVDLPVKTLFGDAEKITHTIVTTSVIGFILFALMLFFTIRGILRPIKVLTESANKIANGNLDADFGFVIDMEMGAQKKRTKNEIDILFASLKNMQESLAQTEQIRAVSKAKSDFLAKMSHEIRTPMNAITGMAELALRKDAPPDAVREHILTIKQASANLLSIINDILDLSRIESGKLEIIPADYHLASLINDVVSIIRTRATDSGVEFAVSVDGKIPGALFGDEIRIRQVMLNILSNAVKYTEKGSITFTVNGKIIDEETVILTVSVADTGRGIKEEDLGKLFGDFVQLDMAANKGIEGTGLGLSITKSLVSAMGGDIRVKSVYGKGSTFTVTLPQKIRSFEPVAIDALGGPYSGAGQGMIVSFSAPGARLLVVDDVNTNLKVAAGLLSPYGIQVDMALNGADAIRAARANRYDLIFMDHMMPGMDGVEATKQIRAFGGEDGYLAAVPIIALTANAVSGVKEMFLQSGFNDFLSKPIDTAKLDALLEKWIPKEKQMPPIADDGIADAGADNPRASDINKEIAIDGIDAKLGLQRTGGKAAGYLRTLAAFGKDGARIIGEIKKSLETDDIPQYVTQVHGLKGAAANIGAVGLSESAKSLEAAGRRNDRAFIDGNTARLLADLEALLRDIDKTVAAEKDESVMTDADKEILKTALGGLREAVGDLDPDAIKDAVKTLRRFENAADIGGAVAGILQNVTNGEYDEAVLSIDNILKEA